jgi:hypothetical protein
MPGVIPHHVSLRAQGHDMGSHLCHAHCGELREGDEFLERANSTTLPKTTLLGWCPSPFPAIAVALSIASIGKQGIAGSRCIWAMLYVLRLFHDDLPVAPPGRMSQVNAGGSIGAGRRVQRRVPADPCFRVTRVDFSSAGSCRAGSYRGGRRCAMDMHIFQTRVNSTDQVQALRRGSSFWDRRVPLPTGRPGQPAT